MGIDPQAAGEKPAKAGGDERLDDAGHGPNLTHCASGPGQSGPGQSGPGQTNVNLPCVASLSISASRAFPRIPNILRNGLVEQFTFFHKLL